MLRETLLSFAGGKIEILLDEMTIESGEEWFNAIRQNLKKANCLILMVPDDSDEREWPIFEAAFFAGRMLPGDRLICLHHPAVHIPRQLVAFQGDKADASGIERLLRRILIEPGVVPGLPAINPNCGSLLAEQAKRLADGFSGPTRFSARQKMNFVKLRLSTPGQFADRHDLLGATVVTARGLSEMFAFTGKLPCELRAVLGVGGENLGRHDVWLAELTDCIREEIAHRRGETPFAKFSTPDAREFFRPVLREIEEDELGIVHQIEIIFGEHLSGITDTPDDLQILEAALRLAARFRSEILGRFAKPRRAEDVERTERVLKRIEREATDEVCSQDMLVNLFSEQDQPAVRRMYDDWQKYRNQHGNGKLDLVFSALDYALLRKALAEIREMNREFTIMATKRYTEMLESECKVTI